MLINYIFSFDGNTNPKSKYRLNGTNGEIKTIRPADPKKLEEYRKAQRVLKRGKSS